VGTLVVVAVVAGCGAPDQPGTSNSAGPSASAAASVSSMDLARAELDRALELLERVHPEPFHAIDRASFVAELDSLKERLPDLAPEEAATELMRIWALLATERDGHQFALPLDDGQDQVLPIRVYEFAEGVFVTDAMAPHRDLAGARVTAIGQTPIGEVLERAAVLVPRDGPATLPSFRPIYLLRAIALRGLGIAGPGAVPVTVETDGEERTVELETVAADAFVAWAGWLPFHGLPPRAGIAYTRPPQANFSVELLNAESVYARYAQIQPVSADEIAELRRLAERPSVRRVVIDLRQNPGGDNTTYGPLLSALRDVALDGRLVVLTDRVTFSAASNFTTQLEQSTSATFAGEPMGGGLNFWDDVDWIELPDFVVPMRLAISTRYWEMSSPDDPRLSIEPDLAVPMRAVDYFAGRDPLRAAVLAGAAD
jgi:hypothetical protein